MKKFTFTIIGIMAMVLCAPTNAMAEDLSDFESRVKATDWAKYAETIDNLVSSSKEFYICIDKTPNGDTRDYRFIDAGGGYGMEAVLDTRGLRFTVTKSKGYYYFQAAVSNISGGVTKNYLGGISWSKNLYMDRPSDDYSKWSTTSVTNSTNNATGYKIYNSGKRNYLYTSDYEKTTYSSTEQVWYLVPVESFLTVAKALDTDNATGGNSLVDLSGLVYNSRFLRNSSSTNWKFYDYNAFRTDGTSTEITTPASYGAYLTLHPTIGTEDDDYRYGETYADKKGCYGAAEIQKSIIMRQEITGIPNGTYIVTAQAFYYDPASQSTPSDAYFFASNKTTSNESRTNGVAIKALDESEYKAFTSLASLHKANLKKEKKETTYYGTTYTEMDMSEDEKQTYFRYNVPAAEFLAQYNNTSNTDYSTNLKTFGNTNYYQLDEEYRRISVEVTVTDGTLTIGFAKTSDTGYAFLDNVKLYYTGIYEFGIDAYNTTPTALETGKTAGVDENQYTYERRFNLSRDFGMDTEGTDTPNWEPIVLPVDLSGSEVKNTFGESTKLAKLNGVSGTTIVFDDVDLSDDTKVALKAGECYVIKVTSAPTIAKGNTYTFFRCSSDKNASPAIEQTYYGPVYHIAGVNRSSALPKLLESHGCTFTSGSGKVTKDYATSDGTLHFHGFFYDTYSDKDGGAPAGSYVVYKGNMYHLSSAWNGIVGTSWYLTYDEPTSETGENTLSISFSDGGTSGIISAVAPGMNAATSGKVYNLNGQKVSSKASLNGLAKGIYIMNGRKYVVK